MFYFAIFIIMICLFALVCFFFYYDKNNFCNFNINIFNLKDYIYNSLKKCNLSQNSIKKPPQNHSKRKNNANIVNYKRLNKTRIYNILCNLKIKKQTYVEQQNSCFYDSILKLSKIIQHKINRNKNSYRAINNECLIETVASSYAHAILVEKQINIFDNFRELIKFTKVYKKEAAILNLLLINKLIELFIILHQDIDNIKLKINKGKKQKKYKHISKLTNAEIYGIFLFNSSSTKLIGNNKKIIIKATTSVLNELDEIYNKQRIIFNYINFLYSGI